MLRGVEISSLLAVPLPRNLAAPLFAFCPVICGPLGPTVPFCPQSSFYLASDVKREAEVLPSTLPTLPHILCLYLMAISSKRCLFSHVITSTKRPPSWFPSQLEPSPKINHTTSVTSAHVRWSPRTKCHHDRTLICPSKSNEWQLFFSAT